MSEHSPWIFPHDAGGSSPDRRSFLKWLSAGSLAGLAVRPELLLGQPDDKKKIPAPENFSVETSDRNPLADRFIIRCTYYEGLEGKENVPIIMLHQEDGTRDDYKELALLLQQSGCSCVTVDLRGHGDSTETTGGKTFKAKDMNRALMEAIASPYGEIEAVKSWLVRKNNEGLCNIEKLGIVAAGMSTVLAIVWAVQDWSWPDLPGKPKQGRDVKALVLLSPTWNYKGFAIEGAMNHVAVQKYISFQIIFGDRNAAKQSRDAEQLYKRLKPFHPDPDPANKEEFIAKKDLFLDGYKTAFQGTKMLGQKALGLEPRIQKFIELRLVNKDYPWSERR